MSRLTKTSQRPFMVKMSKNNPVSISIRVLDPLGNERHVEVYSGTSN